MKNERSFREKQWYKLLLGALPVGVIVGLSALIFMACVRFGTLGLWTLLAGALGMAVYLLFPSIPLVVCMLCVLSALAVSIMKIPISMALIVSTLIQPGLAPVIAVAIIVSFLPTVNLPLLPMGEKQQRSLLLILFARVRPRPEMAAEG